jgi:hypothetical protein
MSTNDRSTHYYSGQGVVMVGERDAQGRAVDLRALGDCTALAIRTETQTLEVQESQSGLRSTAARLVTATNVSLSMTLLNVARDVLALALRGDFTAHDAGTVTAEPTAWHPGGVMPLARVRVSSVAARRGAAALTAWVNDATPWDYRVNPGAGSLYFNDGALQPVAAITTGGAAPTAITVGATTTVTVANSASAGDFAVFTGFTGADAGMINGRPQRIVSATATQVVLALNTTGRTITVGTPAPLSCFSGQALAVDYSFAAQAQVDALTQAARDRFLRFEGLNTLDGNNPVVVEAFRFVADPAAELALISGEEAANFTIEGSLLLDGLQPAGGSRFFRERLLR